MYKKFFLASALSLAMVSSAFAEDAKAQPNTNISLQGVVGVVNVPLILNSLPQAKAESEAMQKEFAPRNEEILKIQEKGKKLSEDLKKQEGEKAVETQRQLAQLQAELEIKGRAFQEDIQKREREVELKLQRLIQTAIDRIAKERGLQLVVRGEVVVYAADAVNISDEVIARASKLKPAKKEDNK